jgi:rubrerythrin
MAITFNADEVFEMAVEIERRAATFYRKAAENSHEANAVETFLGLCEMEKGHERIFAEMKKSLAAGDREPASLDPDGEAAYYLQALAASHGWEGKVGRLAEFTGHERPEQVFNAAIEAEKQSITFYVGLKEFLPTPAAREKVQTVIREEMSHLVSLTKALNALQKEQ